MTTVYRPRDPRPTAEQYVGALWGSHVADVDLAPGYLVADVAEQESATS